MCAQKFDMLDEDEWKFCTVETVSKNNMAKLF